jgi:hypothetical protein
MEWREAPSPGISDANQTTYFETLLDGKKGAKFGVVQHKLLKNNFGGILSKTMVSRHYIYRGR